MLGIKKRDTKQVFKAIAHQKGVSVLEVKERYFGKKRPTPEEYVYTMATKIKY